MENTLPEAPASATVKVKSPKGFEYLFTMRDEKVSALMEKIEKMENIFTQKGWIPLSQQSGFGKPKAPTKPCPVHPDQELRKRQPKDGGQPYWSHSEGEYPNLGRWCHGSGYPKEENQGSDEQDYNF